MARPTKENELLREGLEGQLACLGSAMILIGLVSDRITSTIDYTGHSRMLTPAIQDLAHARTLIVNAQALIKQGNPSVFGGG